MNYIILNNREYFEDKIKINGFKEVENENDRVDAVFVEITKEILGDMYRNNGRREDVLSEQWLLRDRSIQFILCRFDKSILYDNSQKSIEKLVGLYDKASLYIEIWGNHDKKTYNEIECYLFAYNKNFGFQENLFPEETDENFLEKVLKKIEKIF